MAVVTSIRQTLHGYDIGVWGGSEEKITFYSNQATPIQQPWPPALGSDLNYPEEPEAPPSDPFLLSDEELEKLTSE